VGKIHSLVLSSTNIFYISNNLGMCYLVAAPVASTLYDATRELMYARSSNSTGSAFINADIPVPHFGHSIREAVLYRPSSSPS